MPKTEKVVTEATPEKTATDETTKPVEPSKEALNADVRALAEESLNEDNLVGTVEEDGDSETPLDSSTDEDTEDESSEENDSDEDSEEADGTEVVEDEGDLSGLLDNESTDDEPGEAKKSGEQKRIDKLTKQNYEKDAKIQELLDASKKVEEPVKVKSKEKYTKAQLIQALDKARDDGDTALEIEIMEHISDAKADSVKAEYEAKEVAITKAREQAGKDWIAITDMFHYDEIELYPGSQTDLNLKDSKSLIYRLSDELFQKHGFNAKQNGRSKAVSEALKRILAKNKDSAKPQKSSNEKQLEKKVKKLKRKTSSPSGTKSVKADPQKKESRLKTDSDKVSEAISEKKKLQAWKL